MHSTTKLTDGQIEELIIADQDNYICPALLGNWSIAHFRSHLERSNTIQLYLKNDA